jgi:transcriptional regulator with XRE-family HTH domain
MTTTPDRACVICHAPVTARQYPYCSTECKTAWPAAIGKRLATARAALGLSADEVATRLGLSRRAYLAWERGKRQRWVGMFFDLVHVAEMPISADYLLCGDEPMLFTPEQMREILARRDREATTSIEILDRDEDGFTATLRR